MPTSNFFQSRQGINITPGATSVASEGDIGFNSATHKLEYRDNTATRSVVSEDGTQTLTNKTMSGGSNTFSNIAYSSLVLTNTIVNADINASAAIAYSKLNLTGSIVNADINASAAIAYSKLTLTGSIVNADVNAGAAIAYSKLALSNSIVNADIGAGAAIAYSKLNLATSIVNGDIAVAAAITRTKLANGSASHVLINDGSGIISSEATLAKSRGGAGADQSSVTYPATGTIQATTPNNHGVLVSGAAAIATVIAPNASTAFPLISGGASADPSWAKLSELGGGTNQTAYTTGDILYASGTNTLSKLPIGSANQVIKQVSGLPAWAQAPSGGINYLNANPDAEVDTTGWATYADTAKNIPADGTGGAPSSTWTRTTSSPLRGTGAFLWTKAGGANRQGEGVGYAFTIDSADQGRVLAINFDYKVASGTFTAGDGITAPLNDNTTTTNAGNSDLEIFVYDVTNATMLFVGPETLTSTSTANSKFQGLFTASSNSTSYRLIIHTATTTTNNFTLQFDNFFVGPQVSAFGPAMTDWTAFTPTLTSAGDGTNITLNATSKTAPNGFWKRKGDTMEVVVSLKNGSGGAASGTAGNVLIGIPSGYTIDTTKQQANVHGSVVSGFVTLQTSSVPGSAVTYDSTHLRLFDSTGGVVSVATLVANYAVDLHVFLPIVGWSSNVTMDSSVRVAPTTQQFTSGSGTYTTPAGVKWLRVRMVGGGGGAGGVGAGGGNGGDGGDTTFGTGTAAKGTGGLNAGGAGSGGAATQVTGATGVAIAGSAGNPSGANVSGGGSGGDGGASFFGGAGKGGFGSASGLSAATNSGSGGGGGSNTGSSGGGGGGAGAYVEAIITSPAASYSYGVGAAGTAGAGANGGGTGGAGYIIVEENYLNAGTISSAAVAPTIQRFTSSSGTYTLPVTQGKLPLYIKVKMIGGGGGGSGAGTTGASGTAGGDSTFGSSLLTAAGGRAGNYNGDASAPAANTINAPAITIVNALGGWGGPASREPASATVSQAGPNGGSGVFGGAGAGGTVAGTGNGKDAGANTGAGGGGGYNSITNSANTGSGGTSGSYLEALISNPSSSYAYAVGTAGTGGTGTGGGASNGGNGAAGIIIVEEYYQ